MNPASLKPTRKALTGGVALAVKELRYPITGIAGCCARAASGHAAAAALPRSAMKLRRLMQNCPSRRKPTKRQRCASQQNWSADDAVGQQRTSPVIEPMSALPPRADKERASRYVRFVPIAP